MLVKLACRLTRHLRFEAFHAGHWTPDFIPKLTEDVIAMKVIDCILPISGAGAIGCSTELATQERIFAGITSGGTFARALKVAAEAEKGANILCMLPHRLALFEHTSFRRCIGRHE